MQVNRHKVFENKKFRPKDISGALISIMDELGVPEDAIEISGTFKARSGETENKKIALSDLAAIRDFEGQTTAIIVSYPTDLIKGDSKDNSITLCNYEGGILVNVCTNNFPSIQNIMDRLEGQLKLIEMPEKPQRRHGDELPEGKAENRESTNISTGASTEIAKSASCFLSYRYNARVKFLAPELSRFLTLLDIKVVSGPGYEQRRKAGKASGHPHSGYDFFIYLITTDDEGTWTKDELASAYGEGIPVIILIEKGSKTGKEILGGREFIEFDADHIGDTFIAILEAINFMKDQKKMTGDRQSDSPAD
jgi:hypothetical protein